jgi:uncharacterized protein YjbJ (UPF0337 family)
VVIVRREGGDRMNKDQIKGKFEEIKGEVKEKIGGVLKDRKTQAEGLVDKEKGKLQGGMGDVREEVERGTTRKEPEEP